MDIQNIAAVHLIYYTVLGKLYILSRHSDAVVRNDWNERDST